MFSSFFPWEFIQNFPELVSPNEPGLYAFSCYDPFLERIFMGSLPKNIQGGFKVLSGNEVTRAWLENNLKTLDLFAENQSYKVLLAGEINAEAEDFLLNEEIDWDQRFFLLSFIGESKFFDKLKKKKEVRSLKVKAPRFWEAGKLLKFLCEQTGVLLTYEVQNYVLEAIENEPGELLAALKRLALLGKDPKRLTLNEVKRELSQERLDQFELAKIWGEKKEAEFYKSLLNVSSDFESMRIFFNFMQGHTLKMIDTSYMRTKDRLTKYDRQIESHANLWQRDDLKAALHDFAEFEILAKSKSEGLNMVFRSKIISSYK